MVFNYNPFHILGINKNASNAEIKKAFKNIALKCHPDKLVNIKDEKIKNEKIEKFKNASIAYNLLINNKFDFHSDYIDDKYNVDFDLNDVNEWCSYFKDIFGDIYKKYKKISLQHNINLDVKYYQVFNNINRKIRLFLKNIDDPIFIDIDCGKYPIITKFYFDDNDNEHEIIFNLNLIPNDNNNIYSHIINDDKSVDIITTINIELFEYLSGCKKNISYINNDNLIIDIPSFTLIYNKKGFGINNGNLIINLKINNITLDNWNSLSKDNQEQLIHLLTFHFNSNK